MIGSLRSLDLTCAHCSCSEGWDGRAALQIFKKWLSSQTQHDLVCSFNNTEIRQCSLCCGMFTMFTDALTVSSKASRRTVNLTKICEAHRSSVALCRPSSQSLWKGALNSSLLPMTRVQTWEYIDIVEDSLLKELCGFTHDPLFYVTYI